MRTRCLEAPGRDRFGVAGAHLRAGFGAVGGEIAGPGPLADHVDLRPPTGRLTMTLELAQVVAGWPLGGVAGGGGRGSRPARRAAADRAERGAARAAPAAAGAGAAAARGSAGRRRRSRARCELAAAALERLDREINGGPAAAARAPLRGRAAARARRSGAGGRGRRSRGGSLELRWQAGEAAVDGDRCELAQALDNLIVNAIEHGGPAIVVEARRRTGRLRVSVADSGRGSRPRLAARGPGRRDRPARRVGAATATGCAVVRRVAAAHGGRFRLRRSARGTAGGARAAAGRRRTAGGGDEPARPGARLRARGLLAAAAAAAIADGYGASVARGYGALRPVVVAGAEPARRAGRSSPARSPAAGGAAGAGPVRAAGRARRARPKRSAWSPPAAIPAGSYLLAAQLRPPRAGRGRRAGLGGGRRPVEISVSGADALLGAGGAAGRREGRRGRHHRTDRRRRRAAPTSPRRRCRCWRSGPGAEGPGRAAPPRRPSG